jgi:N-acetyl-anhydromuramyl-L-alanine amidase AmpD
VAAARRFPKVNVRRRSPNQSSRSGVAPRLIVLHSTEGTNVKGDADLIGLGSWFASTGAAVSSHVATDADGHSARYVDDAAKAWHCAAYNSLSLGIEQVGRAAQSSWAAAQVDETARWIAYWSRKHGIPIQRGEVSGGRVVKPGIVTHADLGAAGGGHHDPGAAFPVAKVLTRARHFRKLQEA